MSESSSITSTASLNLVAKILNCASFESVKLILFSLFKLVDDVSLPKDFLLFSGDDATGCEFMNSGGDGVISVTANIMPNSMSKMCEFALAGDSKASKASDEPLESLHQTLFIAPNPVMPKWALYKMGLIKTPNLRLPMVLPELNEQATIEHELNVLGLIEK